ncbi:ABC transporter substrate-binding protein [Celeribacter sp.]|uniref:ABC transporter substrate-binding protein n=1 Tax=Celeribacter sp. TaxID=1890673 RepID=UPI003A90F8E1
MAFLSKFLKPSGALGSLFVATALVSPLALPAPAAAGPEDNSVVWASHVLPRVLDARIHRRQVEQSVFLQIYDALLDFDSELNYRPRLAESWEQVDPLTWRFHLREGVRFHNGEPFNAEAVAFSIKQYAELDPPYLYIPNWAPAWPPTAEVEDEYTVVVRTPEPLPNLPRLMMRIGMLPPQATLDPSYADKPVGTGAFKVENWEQGGAIDLVANEDYWDGAPKIDRLKIIAISSAAARVAALQAGEVDFIWEAPLDRLDDLRQDFQIIQVDNPQSNNLIAFNNLAVDSPIADTRVRRALQMTFEGQEIIDGLFEGFAVEGRGPVPSAAYGAYNGDGYPGRDFDAARALLEEAGYGDGFDLTLIAQPGSFTNLTSVVEYLQSQMTEIGVTLKYEELDQGQMSEREPTDTWDLRTDGTAASTAEASYYYNTAKRNFSVDCSTCDELLAKAQQAGDTPEREQLMTDAMHTWWDTSPWLWSFESPLVYAAAPKLQNVELIPNNWTLFRNASWSE